MNPKLLIPFEKYVGNIHVCEKFLVQCARNEITTSDQQIRYVKMLQHSTEKQKQLEK